MTAEKLLDALHVGGARYHENDVSQIFARA
jgi:hypothetical protein